MRYLIICIDPETGKRKAFFTQWYRYENHYIPGMIVIDRIHSSVTFDGTTWEYIETDNL